ncbi:Probable short-chain dehydrogenase/reductase [Mycobacteroides abscessus]|uniref:SDR family NAD(P)-dependent oxidoreductase n=1 Tax=Mycobacteroides abscessus TaxID=36809 RepID=UPI0005DD8778|nr:SDR family NAD(P)-dependent oxidoreductase [Mycobacteroides abscessus]CPU34393.1 Probable short-chain dehydrogenase/reductase [Mycobacteroides abscessus]SLI50860.1 short-chain dehydrogenase/reductase [Mycobacteroides abscessus subsp. massiliense]
MEGFSGKVAVVTGAGSGIGRALAVELARSGAKIAISDVDAEGLAETERQVKALGAEVRADRLNVAEREAFLLYADAIKDHFGKVNQIYNNAGIAYQGEVEESQFKDIERIIDVDFWGVVNVSSLFGVLSMPGQSAYNSAKFAVRGFTESLRQEMIIGKKPVAVTCVHPGGIKTAIARNSTTAEGYDQQAMAAMFDKYLANTSPEAAARIILTAVRKKKPRVLVGPDAKILDVIVRLTGARYQDIFSVVTRFILPRPGKK